MASDCLRVRRRLGSGLGGLISNLYGMLLVFVALPCYLCAAMFEVFWVARDGVD